MLAIAIPLDAETKMSVKVSHASVVPSSKKNC